MRESIKAALALLLIVSLIVGFMAWFVDDPTWVNWSARAGAPVVALMALGLILRMQLRKDEAFDYLAATAGSYFNRDGFCFAIVPAVRDGVMQLQIFFQNQYDRECRGRIGIRPGRGFWMNRAPLEPIVLDVECPAGGFGVSRVSLGVPRTVQGRKVSFEVGASAEYPDGRGELLRFRDGIYLRATSEFRNPFHVGLQVAAALGGAIVMTRPAKFELRLPSGVAETVSDYPPPEVFVLWKQGDPPLDLERRSG